MKQYQKGNIGNFVYYRKTGMPEHYCTIAYS